MILTNARWQASTIEVTDCCMLLFHLGSSRVFSMIDHGTCTRSNNHTWLTNICPYGTKIRNLQHSLDQSFLNNLLNNGPIKRRCNCFFFLSFSHIRSLSINSHLYTTCPNLRKSPQSRAHVRRPKHENRIPGGAREWQQIDMKMGLITFTVLVPPRTGCTINCIDGIPDSSPSNTSRSDQSRDNQRQCV